MTTPGDPDVIAWEFLRLWAESMTNVIGQVTSAPFPVELASRTADEALAPAEGDTYLTITAAGSIRGEMTLRIPQSAALAMAHTFLGNARAARNELSAQDRSGIEELFRQIAGHVSTAAKERWKEVPITVVLGEPPTWSPGATGWLCSGSEAPFRVEVEWQLSSALATSLQTAWQEPASQTAALPSSGIAQPDLSKFDLLMNVELDVTLRFGGRNILLKDILELGAGSVLELDREIQDPADLLLDGNLIAQGEVVVVDGNFGLRVTAVLAAPQDSA